MRRLLAPHLDSQLTDFIVLAPTGRIIAAYLTEQIGSADLAEHPFVKRALAGDPVVSVPFPSHIGLPNASGVGDVGELTESLRRGVITLDSQDVVDATTARTMAETRMGVDRQTLLEEAERYPTRWLAESRPSDATASPTGAAASTAAPRLTEDLLSNDPARVRKALTREDLDARVAALIVPWLAHPEVRGVASTASFWPSSNARPRSTRRSGPIKKYRTFTRARSCWTLHSDAALSAPPSTSSRSSP